MIFREATKEDVDVLMPNKQIERYDYVYTLEHEDKPIMTGGFSIIVPSCAWCWVELTDEARKNLLTTYEVMTKWINEFTESMNIKRLQAFVKNEPKYISLVEHLGFEYESTMTKFYGDTDALMYRRLF